jgi:hypothetical protein
MTFPCRYHSHSTSRSSDDGEDDSDDGEDDGEDDPDEDEDENDGEDISGSDVFLFRLDPILLHWGHFP